MRLEEGPNKDSQIKGKGTIRYIELEGGFFGIVTSDGKKLLPLNLPDNLKVNGLEINFIANRAQVMTLQMWGIPVEIIEVEALKK